MATSGIGMSRELIIHPGEMINDVLTERGITQAELAARTGVSPAHISHVLSGKKDISAEFAMALEYALNVPKSFWLNLQANYDAEVLEANQTQSISEEEKSVCDDLKEIIQYLRSSRRIPVAQKQDDMILSLRKAFQISDLANLKKLAPSGAFRVSEKARVNPSVMGAWMQLCRIAGDQQKVTTAFDANLIPQMVAALKHLMLTEQNDIHGALVQLFMQYGIDFCIVKNFKGAPVQGYITQKQDGVYRIVLTIRGAFVDIFWFSLFHEIGHIANGDIGRNCTMVDIADYKTSKQETQADDFASSALLSPDAYETFIKVGDFSLQAIMDFAARQEVPSCIVIGRLQKEKKLPYSRYADHKPRYKWVNG